MKDYWKDALNKYCQEPEKYPNIVISYNSELVVISDVYPKVDKLIKGDLSFFNNAKKTCI